MDKGKHVAMAKHTLLRVAAAVLMVPSDVFTSPPMIEPPPSSPKEHARRERVSELLPEGWNESDGFTPAGEHALNQDAGTSSHDPSTYGEITDLGARQLFSYMRMNWDVAEEDSIVFLDLGSGAGKLIVQAFLEVPRLQRAVGVELVPARHDAAVRAWNSIKAKASDARATLGKQYSHCKEANVKFIQGDLFEVSVTDATHIYIASLCFSNEMMQRLADKLAKESSELKCVATLKKFPKRFEWKLGTPRAEYVEMSWTKPRGEGCLVYFYRPPK